MLLEPVIAVTDGVDAAITAQHLVTHVAGVVFLVRLDERYVHTGIGHLDVLGSGGATGAATDDDHFLAGSKGEVGDPYEARSGHDTAGLEKIATFNSHWDLSSSYCWLA